MPSEFFNEIEKIKDKREQRLQNNVINPFFQGLQMMESKLLNDEANNQKLNTLNTQGRQFYGDRWKDYTDLDLQNLGTEGLNADFNMKQNQFKVKQNMAELGMDYDPNASTSENIITTSKNKEAVKTFRQQKAELMQNGIDTDNLTKKEIKEAYLKIRKNLLIANKSTNKPSKTEILYDVNNRNKIAGTLFIYPNGQQVALGLDGKQLDMNTVTNYKTKNSTDNTPQGKAQYEFEKKQHGEKLQRAADLESEIAELETYLSENEKGLKEKWTKDKKGLFGLGGKRTAEEVTKKVDKSKIDYPEGYGEEGERVTIKEIKDAINRRKEELKTLKGQIGNTSPDNAQKTPAYSVSIPNLAQINEFYGQNITEEQFASLSEEQKKFLIEAINGNK